jgi:hypothetical protein
MSFKLDRNISGRLGAVKRILAKNPHKVGAFSLSSCNITISL